MQLLDSLKDFCDGLAFRAPKQMLYTRDDGVVCYRAYISGESGWVNETPAVLLSKDIIWGWWSGLQKSPSQAPDLGPPYRPLTRLSEHTSADFITDLLEVDVDGDYRHVHLIGADSGAGQIFEDVTQRKHAYHAFDIEEQGPIRLILHRIGDSRMDLVFVPHGPVPDVQALLDRWGLSPEKSVIRRYKRIFELMFLSDNEL